MGLFWLREPKLRSLLSEEIREFWQIELIIAIDILLISSKFFENFF